MSHMKLLGECSEMLDKYNIGFSKSDILKNIHRLTNQLWKLIPMRENEEDWRKQLDTVILELVGLNEIFIGPIYLQALSKLEALKVKDIDFDLYRKTIFECISLIQSLKNDPIF